MKEKRTPLMALCTLIHFTTGERISLAMVKAARRRARNTIKLLKEKKMRSHQ